MSERTEDVSEVDVLFRLFMICLAFRCKPHRYQAHRLFFLRIDYYLKFSQQANKADLDILVRTADGEPQDGQNMMA